LDRLGDMSSARPLRCGWVQCWEPAVVRSRHPG
jgi:hypothetical protein